MDDMHDRVGWAMTCWYCGKMHVNVPTNPNEACDKCEEELKKELEEAWEYNTMEGNK